MKSILFLCVANSARSQMAEGLARQILGTNYTIQSAGSNPSFVHPLAIQVLAEQGIDSSAQTSKAVTTLDLSNIDLIITLCDNEVCPVVPGTVRRLHWPLLDPAGKGSASEQLDAFRHVCEDLRQRLTQLKLELESPL